MGPGGKYEQWSLHVRRTTYLQDSQRAEQEGVEIRRKEGIGHDCGGEFITAQSGIEITFGVPVRVDQMNN